MSILTTEDIWILLFVAFIVVPFGCAWCIGADNRARRRSEGRR